jgi:hypothetical protein
MKTTGADNQNGSTEPQWPKVPKIASEEFLQSYAVAELAVKLWEIKIAKLNLPPLEKQKLRDNPDLTQCLGEAWELIQKAREHVLEPQSVAEYLVAHGGSHEAGENVIGSILSASRVPFKNLCDPNYETKDDDVTPIELFDSETGGTHKVHWKVYRSERGFDDLFWAWWRETSILKLRMVLNPEAPGNAPDKWEEYGKQKLASWKQDGVQPNDLLALARFRSEHDKRAANLPKKPKRKHRLPAMKYRKH